MPKTKIMLRCIEAFVNGAPTVKDPRWDDDGFNRWADECQLQWVRVDYLRSLDILPAYQDCQPEGLHTGAPPNGVELFNVVHLYLGFRHCDPNGQHLADLHTYLKEANDADLVAIDWCATPQKWTAKTLAVHASSSSVEDPRTPGQLRLYGAFLKHSSYLTTYSPIRTIVLHRVPPDSERANVSHFSITHSAWITYELLFSAYCQRVINSSDAVVKSMISPQSLTSPIKDIREGVRDNRLYTSASIIQDVETVMVPNMRRAFGAMVPVYDDELGFRSFCTAAEIAWVKVSYIRRFVELRGASDRPFPRRQELPRGSFYVGVPLDGRRKYVVSHGWATEHHPSPSGVKMCKLLAALDADKADDEDGVFLDYCSLDQRHRPQPEGSPPQRERTVAEARRFYLALWEMTRMFAHKGCRVVVLPDLELAGDGADECWSDAKERVCRKSSVWGWINDVPYHRRGWCFAEFSCAYKAGIIVNLRDVQELCGAWDAEGGWPTTVQSYTRMMEDPKIEFTSRGDREYVAYIFFKMCFDLRAATDGE